MPVIPHDIARLKRLPGKPDRTWQGGVLEVAIDDLTPDSPPTGAVAGIVVFGCELDDMVGPMFEPRLLAEIEPADVLTALADLAEQHPRATYRPGCVEVCDDELGSYLAPLLAAADIEVRVVEGEVDDLPAVAPFVEHIDELRDGDDELPELPALADAPGVERERVVSFAHAAAAFHGSRPWRLLTNIDAIEIHAPAPPAGLAVATVCGQDDEYEGILFHASYGHFRNWQVDEGDEDDDVDPADLRWNLGFVRDDELPTPDRLLWRNGELPPYDLAAVPLLTVFADRQPRPVRAGELTFVEGLLRALAESTEDELDAGRWRKTVATCDGRVEYDLELADLIAPPSREEMSRRGWDPDERASERLQLILGQRLLALGDGGDIEDAVAAVSAELRGRDFMAAPFEPADDRERAQDLCYHAYDCYGRRRIALARQALALWPECADARVILAEELTDPLEALALLEPAVAAGLAHVEPQAQADCEGDLWAIPTARGYLRAFRMLIDELRHAGRLDEAIERCAELARMDRHHRVDTWRMRVLMLAAQRRDEELRTVAAQTPDEDESGPAFSAWMQALAAYRLHGAEGAEAVAALREARRRNRFVASELTREALEARVDERGLRPGRQGEAQILAAVMRSHWDRTVGAVAWANEARTVGAKDGKGKAGKKRARPGRKGRG